MGRVIAAWMGVNVSVFSIFRKKGVTAAAFVALVLAIAIGRLFVGIPFVPPSGREIVARLSGLPIPVLARSERAVDECSGLFCMDYYGSGLVRLSPDSCAKAVTAAKAQGWRALPLPSDVSVVGTDGAPPTPQIGLFRLERREEEQRFAWIDTGGCRVYAELLLT
jgi:hypothetical protein